MKTQTCLTPTEINKTAIKEVEWARGEKCQVGHSGEQETLLVTEDTRAQPP